MGIVINNGQVCFSGRDAASFHYHARKSRLSRVARGIFSWLFRRKVSVPESVLINQIRPDMNAAFIKTYVKNRNAILSANCSRNLSKQQYDSSCAARALQLVADELGMKHLPENSLCMFTGQPVNDPSAETAIYAVTAGLLDSHGQLKPELGGDVANGGPSNLVGICNAIDALGLDSRCYCSEQLDLYESNRDHTDWECTKSLCSVRVSSPPCLCSNDRLLVLVNNFDTVSNADDNSQFMRVHCVVLRPDESCYDPFYGSNYDSLKKYSSISGMNPSGLYVLISNKRDTNSTRKYETSTNAA